MSIRAVVFDIGGVLEIVDDDHWQDAWIARWELRAGAPVGTVAAASPRTDRTERGFRDWLEAVLELSPVETDAMIADFWDSYCGELDLSMRNFVVELASSLIVATLSNSGDGARREEDRRYGFSHLFDHMVYSHEVGMEKPDPAIYAYASDLIGVQPHEIVFLDDREISVIAAREAGWHAVLHSSTPASIASIREIIGP